MECQGLSCSRIWRLGFTVLVMVLAAARHWIGGLHRQAQRGALAIAIRRARRKLSDLSTPSTAARVIGSLATAIAKAGAAAIQAPGAIWPREAWMGHRKGGDSPNPLTEAIMTNRARIAAISLTLAGVLAGCSSPVSSSLSASAPRSADASAPAAHVFTSRLYGYSVALPASWSAHPGERWGGMGVHGRVDVFRTLPYVAAWAFAVSRPASPVGYATAITKTAAQLPCPAAPQTSQAVTIGGVPARLIGMRCPGLGGALMLTAVTTRGKSTRMIMFEDSSGTLSAEPADRAAFRQFLAGIRLRA